LLNSQNINQADFNNYPECSENQEFRVLAASDIVDAIAFAIENGNVDPRNITVIGVSGVDFGTKGVKREFPALMQSSRPLQRKKYMFTLAYKLHYGPSSINFPLMEYISMNRAISFRAFFLSKILNKFAGWKDIL